MSKLRGEGPSPFFCSPPKSFPEGPFVTMPVLGHPFLEESFPSLVNWSSARGQAGWDVKGGRGSALAREISFVFLVAYGLKVSHSALATGGGGMGVVVNIFWNQTGQFPTYNEIDMKMLKNSLCCPSWRVKAECYIWSSSKLTTV